MPPLEWVTGVGPLSTDPAQGSRHYPAGVSGNREPYLVTMRGLDGKSREVVVYGCGPDEAAALADAWSKAPAGFRMASLTVLGPT